MARHRIHSLSFKKQIVQEYAAGATLNGLAREHDLSRNMIRGGRHGSRWTQPAVGGGHHLRRHRDRLRLPRRHIPMGGGREPDGTARQKPPSMISNLVVASVEELNQTQTMPERVSDHRNLAPCFSADCLLDRGARRLSARERDRGRRF